MEKESVFLTYVRHTFKKWAGFQAALQEGMGGIYASEKEIWMGIEVENYFKRYEDIKPEEIEDYLRAMLENEFDTYFEDDSVLQVCKNFCIAYPLSLANPNAEIFQEMQKKIEVKSTKQPTPPSKEDETPTELKSDEEVPCEKLEHLSVSSEVQEDGWTTVSKKNKKKC